MYSRYFLFARKLSLLSLLSLFLSLSPFSLECGSCYVFMHYYLGVSIILPLHYSAKANVDCVFFFFRFLYGVVVVAIVVIYFVDSSSHVNTRLSKNNNLLTSTAAQYHHLQTNAIFFCSRSCSFSGRLTPSPRRLLLYTYQ